MTGPAGAPATKSGGAIDEAVGEAVDEVIDDELWSAIGDPTRRRLIDVLLQEGAGTATSLGHHLPVTRQAVAKHLTVLDRVGLVRAGVAGREKRYQVDEARLERVVAQLSSVGSAWDARLRRIKRIAESIQRGATDQAGNQAGNQTAHHD